MIRPFLVLVACIAACTEAGGERPRPEAQSLDARLGAPAPPFRLVGDDGIARSPGDALGQVLVLEWFAADCPFVEQAYRDGGALRTLVPRFARGDVSWWVIDPTRPAQGGHHSRFPRADREARYAMSQPFLPDEDGAVTALYGVRTTPEFVVIGRDGRIVYVGGLDDAPMGEGTAAEHPLEDALSDLAAGRTVARSSAPSYGCAVPTAEVTPTTR